MGSKDYGRNPNQVAKFAELSKYFRTVGFDRHVPLQTYWRARCASLPGRRFLKVKRHPTPCFL